MRGISIIILLLYVAIASAQDVTTATPQPGEGIGSFLLRNGYNPAEYKAEFIEKNAKKLGRNNSLLLGVKYVLPTKERFLTEPLLGKKYEKVKIVDQQLKGATYYLVSGHGGPDPGAQGKYGEEDLWEDEYAYDFIVRLARELLSHNAVVHIIIQDPNDGIRDDAFLKYDNDETCCGAPIPLDQNERLKQRADAINKFYKTERSGYCRSVFVHLDSRSVKERIDIFLYHYKKSVKGERLATTMLKKFEQKYNQHQPNRGFSGTVSERNLFVLKESNPPGVFLELGNIQNWADQQRFVKPSNRQAVAEWMAEGMIEDYQNSKRK